MKSSHRIVVLFACISVLNLARVGVRAEVPVPPGGGGDTNYSQLNSWNFADANWLAASGAAPVSWTNLLCVPGGPGNVLLLDSPYPAWLRFNLVESGSGSTNLSLNNGSCVLWFRPNNWGSSGAGGTGPGGYAPLLQVGRDTTNANYGLWTLRLDPAGTNLEFVIQDGNGTTTTLASAPVVFSNNTWHAIALTYGTSSNAALYLDGQLISSNGLPVSSLPPPSVCAAGFAIGGSPTGEQQMHGSMAILSTYNFPLDPGTIQVNYFLYSFFFGLGTRVAQAPSYPTNSPVFNAISGPGYLTWVAGGGGCPESDDIWFENVSATVVTNGTDASMNFTFTVGGGHPNLLYDLYGTARLETGARQWAWLGQVTNCATWTLTNQLNAIEFFRLGNTNDADGDGLRDSYELLVSQTSTNNAFSDGYGTPDAWYGLHGLNLGTGGPLADTDHDGLLNREEYLWGSDPQTPEGFMIWLGSPAGGIGLP